MARQEARKVVRSNIEAKQYDGTESAVIDWSGTTYSITNSVFSGGSAMSQGTGNGQYIGSSIKPTYVMIRGFVNVSDSTNLMRIVVLQVKGGGVPTAATVFESTANIRAPLSPLEKNYDKTYNVLADRLISVNGVAMPQRPFKIKLSGRKMRKIEFNDGAGTIEANGVYVVAVSDSGAAVHPTLTYEWRLHYTDA